MKIAVLWIVEPYNLVALIFEAARISETSVNFLQSTQHNNSEDNQPSSYSRPWEPEISHGSYIILGEIREHFLIQINKFFFVMVKGVISFEVRTEFLSTL
jgi:hypothetical protein